MKKILIVFILLPLFSLSQTNNWQVNINDNRSFIENKGQYINKNWQNNNIEFGYQDKNFYIFFTNDGLTYRFDKMIRKHDEHSKEEANENNESKWTNISELIHIKWLNANINTEIIPVNKTPDYHSFAIKDYKTNKIKNINHVYGYKRIIYKNIYDKIDLIYDINPEGGIEYSFILHKGADVNKIKMKYTSGHTNVKNESIKYYLDDSNNFQIYTSLGHITEKGLKVYYNETNQIIKSTYKFNNNILSFNLENYDNSQEITIDPFVVNETANSANSSSAVWEVETDNSGNVYTISNEDHMQLKKYSSTGAPIWTYDTPWDTSSVWLGTLATDDNGTSYITSGVSPEIERINTSGGMDWHATGLNSSCEYWSITFNCDKTKLIVGGTYNSGMLSLTFYSAIYDIDINNGNVLGYTTFNQVNGAGVGNFPIEVRGICAAKNSKYLYVTHQDVGLISQNFGQCPNARPVFQVDNSHHYAYKCENYLPETQNGGGLKAITANDQYFYTHTGDKIYKRSFADGSVITSVNLPGGSASSSLGIVVNDCGLDVDDCGNVYAGSSDRVVKYDADLNFISEATLPFTVYDVSVNNNGEVIAAGAVSDNSNTGNRQGKVQAVNMGACSQYVASCCDANICPPAPVCNTDPAFNLSASTPGGTWSGTGITDANAGTFDPSVSGLGTFWVYYTLSCGSDSAQVQVIDCSPFTVCDDGSNLVANGGAGTGFSWNEQDIQQVTIGNEAECIACPTANPVYLFGNYVSCDQLTCDDTVWVEYATGTTAPYPNTWPLMVTNGHDTLYFNSQSDISPCSACTPPDLQINDSAIVCAPNTVDLSTQVISDGGGNLTYLDINTNTLASSTVTSSGSYIIQSTDPNDPNCYDRDTIVVIISDPSVTITGSTTFCTGGSSTLDAGAGYASYSWSTGDNSQTITVTSSGNYSVTVTDNYGCPADTFASVTVAANLSPVITGNLDYCAGGSTVLDAGAGYDSYSWSTTAASQTINVTSPGTYSVTVTSGGCSGDTSVTVVENPNPTVTINGSTTFCTGSSEVLDAGSGYASYSWNTGDNTQTITINTAGTYIVTITDVNGCSEDDTITVTQSTGLSPTITGNLTFCTGSSTTLDAGSGYANYSWSTSATSQTIIVNTAGTYSVTVDDGNGCTGSASVNVTETTPPTVTITGNTQICSGVPTNLDAGSGYASYSWSDGTTTQIATVTSGGTYTVTITDNNGCTASNSVVVNEDSIQSPNITGPSAICGNDNATFDAGSGYNSYIWNTGDNTQTITVNTQGIYSVTVTNSSGCTANSSIILDVSPAINLSTTSTNTSCYGYNDGTANVIANGGTNPLSFQWSTGDTTQSITNAFAGYYQITVTDAVGCSQSTSVLINQPSKVYVSTNPNQKICIGDTAYIHASATGGASPYTYFWNTGDNNSQIIVNPNTTTDYYVYAIDANGCSSDSISVNIFVYPPLSLDIYPDDYYVCKGDAFNILADASGGNGQYTYTLEDGTIITPPYLYYTTQTIKESVQVTLTDNCGTPSIFDTLSVYILPLPEFTFQPDITLGCQPLTVNFSSYANNSSYEYYWDFGDINSNDNNSLDINPSHIYDDYGTFSVTLTAKTDSGCTNSLTVPDLITVYQKPISKFKADKNIASVINPQINYYNLSSYASTYHWMFGDGDSSIIYSPSHLYPENPNVWYDVTLIVKTEHNCVDTSYDRIFIRDEYTFYAPTAFTPDGDGVNDEWFVVGHGISDENFRLLVFNRWGEIIWESTSQYNKWDGTVKGGKELAPMGEYTWKVYYLDDEKLEHSKAGAFMLIR